MLKEFVRDEFVALGMDMEALRLHLGLDRIVSIGTSYGGMVAMAHAARYPESVSHLVLCVTASHSGFVARAKQIVAERDTAEQKAVCDQLWAGELTTVDRLRYFYDVMGPLYSVKYNATEARIARERGIMNPQALNRAFAPGGFLLSYDLRPELKNITAPTLIVAGRHDWICAPEFSEEIHRLIPGSDLRIFEESSHSVRADEPERLIDAIAGFTAPAGTALPARTNRSLQS